MKGDYHMIAWGKAIVHAMNGFNDSKETGLVRMFRTEYAREYYWLRKQGVAVNDQYVRRFLGM
jgi:hypothetical protein